MDSSFHMSEKKSAGEAIKYIVPMKVRALDVVQVLWKGAGACGVRLTVVFNARVQLLPCQLVPNPVSDSRWYLNLKQAFPRPWLPYYHFWRSQIQPYLLQVLGQPNHTSALITQACSNMSGNGQGTSQGDSSNTATATTVPVYGIPISGKESKQIIIVREECKSPQWATQASNPSKEVQQLR